MENDSQCIRFIIEDSEYVLLWKKDIINDENLVHVMVYMKDILRKQYKADQFTFQDQYMKTYNLIDIAKHKISPVYLSIPNKPNIQTAHRPDKRRYLNKLIFLNPNMISVQKFDNMRKLEQYEVKMANLKMINQSNKEKQYDDVNHMIDRIQNLKIEIKVFDTSKPATSIINNSFKFVKNPKGDIDPEISPTFPNIVKPILDQQKLQVTRVEKEDLSKKPRIALGNGKSQLNFNKSQEITPTNSNNNSKNEPKTFTIEEVRKHSKQYDCWTIINGKIYDITRYMDYHPGGKEKLMLGAGEDCTALFNKYHSWVNASALLSKDFIGYLRK